MVGLSVIITLKGREVSMLLSEHLFFVQGDPSKQYNQLPLTGHFMTANLSQMLEREGRLNIVNIKEFILPFIFHSFASFTSSNLCICIMCVNHFVPSDYFELGSVTFLGILVSFCWSVIQSVIISLEDGSKCS